jgi:hypothetical protein
MRSESAVYAGSGYRDLEHKDFTIICGHYGCGKTNLSINLAVSAAAKGRQVTLVDFDIVNPYFRSSDYVAFLEGKGVKVVAPVFAGASVDLPMIAPEVSSVFDSKGCVIIDVGGDGAGAAVLGRYADKVQSIDYDMLYIVNMRRALSTTAEEAVELLWEIEAASRLKATAIVNNTHLMGETTPGVITGSFGFAAEVSAATGLAIRSTVVPSFLAGRFSADCVHADCTVGGTHAVAVRAGRMQVDDALANGAMGSVYPADIYVLPPWSAKIDEEA